MRARKKKWAPAELNTNPLIIQFNEASAPIDLTAHFANAAPVHLEIGCGKGRFITESARRNPHINFLAIEREADVLAAAARRARTECETANCAFLLLDVSELENALIPGQISRLYINFCDPWPRKKKWAKRRLTHENFLQIYRKLEIPEVHFKTDNRPLFEFSIESFSANNWRMENISLDLHANMPEDNIVTEYEEKFAKHGPIYRLQAYPNLRMPAPMRQ